MRELNPIAAATTEITNKGIVIRMVMEWDLTDQVAS
jgi:hypothetical protein